MGSVKFHGPQAAWAGGGKAAHMDMRGCWTCDRDGERRERRAKVEAEEEWAEHNEDPRWDEVTGSQPATGAISSAKSYQEWFEG